MPFGLSDLRFEHPAWLQLLWLAPLIVALYLLRRRATQRLVAHLPLWEKALAELPRRRPRIWRTLLSILLQLAILTGLCAAVAGPYAEREVSGRGHSVILLDRSLGTRARGTDGRQLDAAVLERGRALASEALEHGTVAIGAFADALLARLPATTEAAAVEKALSRLPAPRGSRSWEALLPLVTAAAEGTRVLAVSPFTPPAETLAALRERDVGLYRGGEAAANGGIRSVRRDGRGLRVGVAVSEEGRSLDLLEGEVALAGRPLDVAAGLQEVLIPLSEAAGSELRLRLIPPDAFPGDDSAEITLPERDGVRVLVAADGTTPFLDAWLQASRLVDVASSGRVATQDFRPLCRDYDVTVVVGWEGAVPLPPGRFLLLGSGASNLTFQRDPASEGRAEALEVRSEDPLVRALDLDEWTVSRVVTTRARLGLEVIVEGSRGPLLARGEVRDLPLRFVYLAIPPTPQASSLPLLPAFPLILEAALLELAGDRSIAGAPVLQAGGELEIDPGVEALLVSDSGATEVLEPLDDGRRYRLPERPGRYRIGGDGGQGQLALAWLDHPGLPGPPLREDMVAPAFPLERATRSLRPLLLALVAGLLLCEWLLYQFAVSD